MINYIAGSLIFFALLMILRKLSCYIDQDISWNGYDSLEIVSIDDKARDIKSFGLRRRDGTIFPRFRAGQFLTFKVNATTVRNYSICSSAKDRKEVAIAIKKIKDGVGSNWFHNRSVGDCVCSKAPSGSFVLDKGINDVILVAGGIGITPVLSMARTLLDIRYKRNIYFFYGCRNDNEFAFNAELKEYDSKHSNFKYIPVASAGSSGWDGEKGHVTADLLERYADIVHCGIYICGPPPMIKSLEKDLKFKGAKDINYERFIAPASAPVDTEMRRAQVIFNGKEYQYDGKERLLDFLEGKGENIPNSCRVGMCGTCRCELLEGEVSYDVTDGIDPGTGHVLCCVAKPITDVRMRL